MATRLAFSLKGKVLGLMLASPGDPECTPPLPGAWSRPLLQELLARCVANKDGRGDRTGSIPRFALDQIQAYWYEGSACALDRVDEHTHALQLRYGPGHSSAAIRKCLEQEGNPTNTPLWIRQSIEAPILILKGAEDTTVSPDSAVDKWRASFTSAKGGASVYVVAGGPHLVASAEASIVNRFIFRFTSRCVMNR